MKTNFLKTRAFSVEKVVLMMLTCLLIYLPHHSYGQAGDRQYADVTPSSGRNSATFVLGLFGNYTSTSNNNRAQVLSPSNAGDGNETTHAELRASNINILGLGQISGEAWVQMKFPAVRPANTTTYVRIDPATASGISVDLIATLGGLLGLLENNVILPEVYSGAHSGSNGSLISSDNVSSTMVMDGSGNLYLAVTSSESYNSVRVKLRNQGSLLGLSLGSTFHLNVYDAFTLADPTCGSSVFTDLGQTSGITLSLGDVVQNPENAIDGNESTHSTITTGTLNLLGSAFQTFHFNGLSAPQDYFKFTFKIGGGSLLDLDLLGNFEVRAYNGDQVVYTKKLQGALVNGLDLLTLLQSGDPVTVPFGPGVPFDRVAIGINTTVAVNLAGSPLEVYAVERYGLGGSPLSCTDPNPPVTDEGGEHMLSNRMCAEALVSHEYANFPLNVTDGSPGTYAVLEATSGSLLGAGAYSGHIELGYSANVAANTTSYLKIDMGDEGLLSSLLNGSLGGLLGGVLDNVVFGNHYFDIRVNDANGNDVLSGSSANAFNGLPIQIVQDKHGHFYVAITPDVPYRSIRITQHFPALVGAEASREMKVYGLCYSTGSDDCEQAFATYSESGGISLDLLGIGGAGVQNAHLAIDDDAASVEDDNTYSEIGIGTAGVGASVFQHFDFHTLSSPTDYFKVKIGVENGSVLNLSLLNNIELRAYDGDDLVYSQRIQNGLAADLDILGLLSTANTVTIPIGPGKAFDRIAIGINTAVGLDVFTQSLRVYSVKRFTMDDTCPDPNPLPIPPTTEPPFNTSNCGNEIGEFENANFPLNAVDGHQNSHAILSAGSGVLLGAGGFDGFIEMGYNAPVSAGETSYIRIDMPEQGLLDALVAGSLGEVLVGVVDNLLLGHYFFELSVRRADGSEIYQASSVAGLPNNGMRLVKDGIGRYYIAFTADENYQSVRLTLKNQAIAGLNAVNTMNVYGMCRETEFNPCEQATFTSFGGTGLTLGLIQDPDNPAGVRNPQYVIDSNNSNFSEFSLGAVNVSALATIHQDIHFKAKVTTAAEDVVRLRLQVPTTLADAGLLGNFHVHLYDDDNLVYSENLTNIALISGLDLLGLLNTGGVVSIDVTPGAGLTYNTVRFELRSPVGVNLSNAVRLYTVHRISADCPDPDFEQPPFSACADVIVDANEYVDDIQNLVDGNHNSYATIRSDAGLLPGVGSYSGSLEIGYGVPVAGGTASYIRIGYEEDILNSLLAGSIGGLVNQALNSILLGHHYFEVIVKDDSGNTVVSGRSDNVFSGADGQITLVQDTKGRYYLRINPTVSYQSVELIDHTTALLGLGLSEGQLHVYGMCHTPTTFDCPTPFSTSWDGSGLTVDVLGAGGAGVQNAFWAIDQNPSSSSTLSLGAAGVGSTIEQRIQFDQTLAENSTIGVKIAVGSGTLSTDILSTLQVKGYLSGVEVFSEDFNQAFLEANILDLLNNGSIADLTIELPGDVDEIGIELASLVSIGVAPNVSLYHVFPHCESFSQSYLEVTEDFAVADGIAENEVTATILNATGNPVNAQEVIFTVEHVDDSTTTYTGTTDTNGKVAVPITSTVAGTAEVTATVEGMVITIVRTGPDPDDVADAPAIVTFIAGPVDHAQSTLEVTKDNALADDVDFNELTARIVDAHDNPIEGADVAFDITYPDGSTGQEIVTTDANGSAVLQITSPVAGNATVTATVDGTGISGSPATVTFIRPNNLSVTKVPDQDRVIAGTSTTFTVTITNDGPAPLSSGSAIRLAELPSAGLTITGYSVTSGNATVTSSSGNTATVTTDEEIPVDGTVVLTITADVAADAPATVENQIQIWAPDQDPDTDSPDDEDTTDPIPVDRDYGFDNDAINKRGTDNGSGGIANAFAGGPYTYTVVVTNNGPSVIEAGTTVYFQDVPSIGQTLTEISYDGTPLSFDASTGRFDLPVASAVPVDGTFTFDVTVDVAPDAPTTVKNTIHIWQDDPETDLGTPDSTAETPDIPVDRNYGFDDDAINKVGSGSNAVAGTPYTYTVTVQNNGPSSILDGTVVYFRDLASTGQSLTEVSYDGVTVTPDANGLFNLTVTGGGVAVGETFSFEVTVTVAPDAPATIVNTIQIWQEDPGTDPGNLPDPDGEDTTDPIPVDRDYGFDDDAINKVGSGSNAVAGTPYTYTVTVRNNGPSDIAAGTAVYFRDLPSTGQTLTNVNYAGSSVPFDASTGRFDLTVTSAVPVGETFTFDVTVDVAPDAPTTVKNTIHIWQNDPETDLENPDGTAETPDIPVNRQHTLGITKVANDARVVAGGSTSFTITVINNGPSDIAAGQQILLREQPGDGVTITGYSVTNGPATIAGTGNEATLTTGAVLPVGGTITVLIHADISADAGATITNGIAVWGPDKDPETDTPDDDDDIPEIPVDREYNLGITKVANDARVVVGGSTSFTITVTNNGPSDIAAGQQIALREQPGDGVTITGYSVTNGPATIAGTGNEATLTTGASLPAGGIITVLIHADISADAGETITNGIAVWGPDKDPETDTPDDDDEIPDVPVDRMLINAVDDQAEVKVNLSVTIDVLANDVATRWAIDPSTVEIVDRPQNGLVEVLPTGEVVYTPNSNYVGQDHFTYRVQDEQGQFSNVARVDIVVFAGDLRIPNAFTPNGDGVNDYFEIEGLAGFDRVELVVINRHGNEVYRSHHYQNEWDGSNLNAGTYYYVLRTYRGSQEEVHKGWVLIKR